MINFIINKTEFDVLKKKYAQLFYTEREFEDNIFRNEFKYFAAFDFDFIYDTIFFENIQSFIKSINKDSFIFYPIDPSPEDYYFKNFRKYNVIKIGVNNTFSEFNEIVMRDPDDSPADTIALSSDTLVLFSDFNDWAITGCRDLEIGIIGFSTIEIRNIFFKFFENSEILYSLNDYIELLDNLNDFSENRWKYYNRIIKNYTEKKTIS